MQDRAGLAQARAPMYADVLATSGGRRVGRSTNCLPTIATRSQVSRVVAAKPSHHRVPPIVELVADAQEHSADFGLWQPLFANETERRIRYEQKQSCHADRADLHGSPELNLRRHRVGVVCGDVRNRRFRAGRIGRLRRR